MRHAFLCFGPLAAVFVGLLVPAITCCDEPKQSPRSAAELIRQLGDDQSQVRDAASRALRESWPSSIPELEQAAAKHADPEVRARASNILAQMAGRLRSDNLLKLSLAWCPPGKFTMGSPEVERNHLVNEAEVEVTLTTGFWIGQFEVTQSEWRAIMDSTPWHKYRMADNDRNPATEMTIKEAREFCSRLTERERRAGRIDQTKRYDLPTEAQWEYACRAGTTTPRYFSESKDAPMALKLSDFEWYGQPRGEGEKIGHRQRAAVPKLHAVGLKKPNPWGLYDLLGNASEQCRDMYAKDRKGGKDPLIAFTDSSTQLPAVFRGGNVFSDSDVCRCALRCGFKWANSLAGFRVALVNE
jgi:formylglycine-generating enzyme required for sulfatase activity